MKTNTGLSLKSIAAGLLAAIMLFSSGCALFPRKAVRIDWPDRVQYFQAFGEVDIRWKDMRHSGTMALTLEYPDKFHLEVYGPFGETGLYVNKDKDGFLLVSGDERITDQRAFEKKLGIRLPDLMDDIAMKNLQKDRADDGSPVDRGSYTVTYSLSDGQNRICWRSDDGTICIRFLEARFDKE